MGKDKNTKSDKKGGKKKNRCCLKCCVSTLIILIVMVGAGIGVGWYFGDRLLQQHFDVKLSQVFKAYGNFKNYKKADKKIKNTFKAGDEDAFLKDLGKALFIKAENLDTEEIKDVLMDMVNQYLPGGESSDAQPDIAQLVLDLFENDDGESLIDTEWLKAYEPENIEDYYLNIKDKNLAAFINNAVLNSVLEAGTIQDMLKDMVPEGYVDTDEINLKDILQLKQITFYKNAANEAHIKVSTQTNLHSLIKDGTAGLKGETFVGKDANKFLKFGITAGITVGRGVLYMVLPKIVYLTVDMPASKAEAPAISLNSTTAADLKVVDKLTKGAVTNAFDGIFGEKGAVGGMIKSLNKTLPLADMITNSAGGKANLLKYDIIELGIELSKLNYTEVDGKSVKKPDDQCIHSNDVYSLLSNFLNFDTEEAIESLRGYEYTNWEFVKDANDDFVIDRATGMPKLVQKEEDKYEIVDISQREEIQAEYERAFLHGFFEAYCIKDDAGITFDNVFDLISGGDLVGLFDPEKIKDIVDPTKAVNGLQITDKMLAAIVSKRINDFVGGDLGGFDTSTIIPRYIVLSMKGADGSDTLLEDGTDHNFIEIGIELDISALISGMLNGDDAGKTKSAGEGDTEDKKTDANDLIMKILAGLLPKSVLVRAKMDITLTKDPEFEYAETQLWLDKMDSDEMNNVVRILDIFGVFGDSGMSDFLSDMLSPIRTTISDMNNTLEGLSLASGAIIVPDVFEAVASIINKDKDDSSQHISAEDLRENIDFALNINGEFEREINASADAFAEYMAPENPDDKYTLINQFEDKYALTPGMELKELLDKISGAGGEDNDFISLIDEDKFKALIKDDGDIDELNVFINSYGFWELLDSVIATMNDPVFDDYLSGGIYDVRLQSRGGRDYLSLTVKVLTDTMFAPEDEMNAFICSLIPYVFVTLEIDITSDLATGEKRDSSIVLNGNGGPNETEDKTGKFMDMLKNMGLDVESSMDELITALEDNIINTLDAIKDSEFIGMEMGTDNDGGDAFVVDNLFVAVAGILSKDIENEADKIKGDEIKDALAVIYNDYTVDPDIDFKNHVYDENHDITHKDSDTLTPGVTYEAVDYTQLLLEEFQDSYGLSKIAEGETDPYSFERLMGTFGVGESGGPDAQLELSSIISSDGIKRVTFEEPEEIRVELEDNYLAGMIYGDFANFAGGQIDKDALLYTTTQTEANKNYINVGAQLKLSDYISDNDFAGLMPENFFIDARVEITPALGDDEESPVVLRLNGKTPQETTKLMETLNKMGSQEGGSLDSVDFNDIGDSVRKAFKDMNDHISVTMKDEAKDILVLPNIFELMYNVEYKSNTNLDADKIQKVFQELFIDPDNAMGKYFDPDNAEKPGRPRNVVEVYDENDYPEFEDVLSAVITPKIGPIMSDPLTATLGIDDNEIGGLLNYQMGDFHGSDIIQFNIIPKGGTGTRYAQELAWLNSYDTASLLAVDKDHIAVTVNINLTELGGASDDIGEKILGETKLLVTLVIEVDIKADRTDYRLAYYRLNSMDEETRDLLLSMFGMTPGDLDTEIDTYFNECTSEMNSIMGELNGLIRDELPSIDMSPLPPITPVVRQSIGAVNTDTTNAIGQYVFKASLT